MLGSCRKRQESSSSAESSSNKLCKQGRRDGNDAISQGVSDGSDAISQGVSNGSDANSQGVSNGSDANSQGVSNGSDAISQGVSDGSDANSQGVSDGSNFVGEESMDVSYSDSTASSSSQDTSTDTSPNLGLLAENVVEIEVDFNEKVGKKGENLPKTGIPNVLKAEFALRNTNGGIVKLKMKTALSPVDCRKKFNEWVLKLNDKRHEKFLTSGKKEQLAHIIDYRPKESLIFVRKSSVILTEKSNLYERRGPQKYELQSFFEIQDMLLKKNELQCCCTYELSQLKVFEQGKHMPYFGESVLVEYKELTSKNLPDMLRERLSDYIVEFANTSGGYVYFGVSDDGIIKGQNIRNKGEQGAIRHKIDCCMNSKIWINKSGERETPICDTHYQVDFNSVSGADQNTYVIVVHICRYAGTVFLKEPECPVINDQNQFDKMSFEKWLAAFQMSSRRDASNMNYRDRFEKRIRGTSVYFSVKETVKTLVAEYLDSPGQLKLHPEHAVKWIKHQALDRFVELLKKTLEEQRLGPRVAYIERSWEVNLGLPSTKPDDIICDVLLCGPEMPFVFVSITSNSPTEKSFSYTRMMATRLKATLVDRAFCLEKFYVKPTIISEARLLEAGDVSFICSENPAYPETYRMNYDKYINILEALVLVLARANVMATDVLGQGVFNLLTREQYKILHEFYEDTKWVKITGPPGSGKTVLAFERIRRLRDGGCRDDEVLFLCSNKPLEAIVNNMKACSGRPLCTVKTYYDIASIRSPEDFHFIGLGNVKHVLADEVQNFQEDNLRYSSLNWWYHLQEFLDNKEDSSFWVFFDIAQKINNICSVSLRGFSQKKLKTIIRTTGNVYRFITDRYMSADRDVLLGHDWEGPKVKVLAPKKSLPNSLAHLLFSLLKKLIRKKGHDENNITVLFNDIKQQKAYFNIFSKQTNHICAVRNGEEVLKQGVTFDTIRRYSGVDANIIIGFCPEYYTSDFQNNDALMTSLCSRTKIRIILIFEDAQKAEPFGLASDLKYVE